MSFAIQIVLSEQLSLRDPNQTELGRKILEQSIAMIDQLGFEGFTFKKLAAAIQSTEASVYRYFENKHQLLRYLVAWYWAWLTFVIDYEVHNIADPRQRLRRAVEVLTTANVNDPRTAHVNEGTLHRIVVAESAKAFLHKDVDRVQAAGLFQSYEQLVERIAALLQAANPQFAYPKALAVTVIDAARMQLFLADHIPVVTEIGSGTAGKQALLALLAHIAHIAPDAG